MSAVCEDDCRLYAIAKDKVLELYYQNPRFGFFLIRLVSGIVQQDDPRASPAGTVGIPTVTLWISRR